MFMHLIFVIHLPHENILTTNISQITVYAYTGSNKQSLYYLEKNYCNNYNYYTFFTKSSRQRKFLRLW